MTFEEFIALVREDEWFREHHLKNVTQELGEAWIDFYQPDMLDFAAEGTHEFCIRFAFFMMGWQARILQEQRCYAPRS
jgi:hypothetical protein